MYQSVQDDYKASSNLNPFGERPLLTLTDPRQRRMMKPKSESRLAGDISGTSKHDTAFDKLNKIDPGMEKYKDSLNRNSEKVTDFTFYSERSNIGSQLADK